MHYLNVPFSEKELAKQQGARWDPLRRKWYVPPQIDDLKPFSRWLNHNEPTSDSPIRSATPTNEPLPTSQGLAEFLVGIQTYLLQHYTQAQWVRAEIGNLSERRGHWYLELSESDSHGQTLASCRAMIWASQAEAILQHFEKVTASPLAIGQKVLLQVQVNFHEKFGLSLLIQDIDPKFTLGEIEANLIAIRQQLISAGLYRLNKQHQLAADLFNIAVISPPQAAGLGDFRADAEILVRHQLCQFTYFHSSFQGENVLTQMQGAFAAFKALHQRHRFDALVIIRGGGAKLDLHPLNQFELAKLICEAPLPVLTGIGHERDNTLLDEVAHTRFDTPSKVINGIWQQIQQAAQQTQKNWQHIERLSQQTLLQTQHNLNTLYQACQYHHHQTLGEWQQKLTPLFQQIQHRATQKLNTQAGRLEHAIEQVRGQARYPLWTKKRALNHHQQQIQQHTQRVLLQTRQRIKQFIAYIFSAGPQSQLKRGFSLVSTNDNQPITSCEQAQQQTQLILQFHDGKLTVYTEKQEKQHGQNKNSG
ncbi:MAG: exodeoxyribonuclease VII large subunit [Thiomicrospira sp.]